MGLDARIYVIGAQPFDSESEFCAGVGEHLSAYSDANDVYTGTDSVGTPWVEGYERYFSASYPRGYWPRIRKALEWVRECFPGYDVIYGSDHDFDYRDGREVTDKMLSEFDEAWTVHGYDEDE